MIGLLKMMTMSGWAIVALTIALGVQTGRIQWIKADLATKVAEVATLKVQISVQNDQVARWKMESDRQKALVAKSAQEARSAAQKWQARLDAAKSERPAVTPSDGSFAACHGSMKWLKDQSNKVTEAWNVDK